MVHVHGSLAEPIHLVERNQNRQELIRDSLLERGRWDASENSDESLFVPLSPQVTSSSDTMIFESKYYYRIKTAGMYNLL